MIGAAVCFHRSCILGMRPRFDFLHMRCHSASAIHSINCRFFVFLFRFPSFDVHTPLFLVRDQCECRSREYFVLSFTCFPSSFSFRKSTLYIRTKHPSCTCICLICFPPILGLHLGFVWFLWIIRLDSLYRVF